MIVVYVDRNRLQFFESNWSSVLSLDIPETMIRDMEVVNWGQLASQVRSFFQAHAIRPTSMLVILSQAAYFFIELVGEESAKEKQLEEFTGMVPFESVHAKRYTIDKRDVGVVIPKTFVETMEHIFEAEGFRILAMVPVHVLASPMAEKRWMDVAMGAYAIKEANTLARENILEHSNALASSVPAQGGRNQRLMLLIGAFILLIFILVFLILRP